MDVMGFKNLWRDANGSHEAMMRFPILLFRDVYIKRGGSGMEEPIVGR